MNALLAAQVIICSPVQHLVKFHVHLDIGRMVQIEFALHATLHAQNVQDQISINAPLVAQGIFCNQLQRSVSTFVLMDMGKTP